MKVTDMRIEDEDDFEAEGSADHDDEDHDDDYDEDDDDDDDDDEHDDDEDHDDDDDSEALDEEPDYAVQDDGALVAAAASGSELANLGLVPVQLRFEMGLVSLSLKELNALTVGAVIALQGEATPPQVTIKAGAHTVGRGELVDIDGRLGVQVVQWVGQ
jgi:type III secretion system YscQ/HrcQ family protein